MTCMDKNPIGELMQNTMENVRNILKVDTVVGDPIYTPDGITLVPISKISVGFGGGGVEFNNKKVGENRPFGGGNATGVKIDPIGFLVINQGRYRQNGQCDASRQQYGRSHHRARPAGDGSCRCVHRQTEPQILA